MKTNSINHQVFNKLLRAGLWGEGNLKIRNDGSKHPTSF